MDAVPEQVAQVGSQQDVSRRLKLFAQLLQVVGEPEHVAQGRTHAKQEPLER